VTTLRVATRGSLLARTQTGQVVDALRAAHPGLTVEIVELTTSGDRIQDRPLPEVGGKGLFTLELEEALRQGRADVAVHSLKDLPTALADDLVLAAVPKREDPRDALVLPQGSAAQASDDPLRLLAPGVLVGTSSTRRVAMLRHRRPGLAVEPVRGNLDTRLRKLDEGRYAALLLAAAGLRRLGWGERISALLPPAVCMPAPAQGALGLEARAGDEAVLSRLAAVNDPLSHAAVTAERALLTALGGGCLVPVGALATVEGEALVLQAAIASPDGTQLLERTAVGPLAAPEDLGRQLAQALLAAGAERLLGG